MSQLRSTFLATVVIWSIGSATSASVVISDGYINSQVVANDSQIFGVDSWLGPTNGTATALIPGLLSETARVAGIHGISIEFDMQRTGGRFDQAQGYSTVELSPLGDVSYSIAGSFTNSLGWTFLDVSLYDITSSQFVFRTTQTNQAASPYTVELGVGGASESDLLTGSSAGTLISGHTYAFAVNGLTTAIVADEGATASGSVMLQLADQTVVPEPGSIAVWSCFGMSAFGAAWWRKRGP